MTFTAYTTKKKGQGAFWLSVAADGSVEASWEPAGATAWKFPSPQDAYDHFHPMAEYSPSAWNICYHLEDAIREGRQENRP